MNRRELLAKVGGAMAGAGVAGTVKAIEPATAIALVVTTTDSENWLSENGVQRLSAQIKAAIPNCPPVIVMPPGWDMHPLCERDTARTATPPRIHFAPTENACTPAGRSADLRIGNLQGRDSL